MGMTADTGLATEGSIELDGEELVGASTRRLRALRRHDLAMLFQEPAGSLDPVLSIGTQLVEVLTRNRGLDRRSARQRAAELLAAVGIDEPERRVRQYPHELSGGMCQRACLALALAAEPKLLVADEPTSALDVTVRGQILDRLASVRASTGLAVLLVTHDMQVAASADLIAVLYAGCLVEVGTTAEVLERTRHPYTAGLLSSVPGSGLIPGTGRLPSIPGSVPPPGTRPAGCVFAPRCPLADDTCQQSRPPLVDVGDGGHQAACWHADALGDPAARQQLWATAAERRPAAPVTVQAIEATGAAGSALPMTAFAVREGGWR
jgi:oligopeptide/dipeptide ABC transporter ATP-binding protein